MNKMTTFQQQINYKDIDKKIHRILKQTKSEVYTEGDIRKVYHHISGIDHLIISNNLCIAINDKHLQQGFKKQINGINEFRNSVNNLSNLINKRIIGVYLSLNNNYSVFDNFSDENFITICNSDRNKLILDLLNFLYSNSIYIYESEEDVYMLDSEIFQKF